MTDAQIARRLGYIHQTLELTALLLAVLLVTRGGIGLVVGGGGVVVLTVNVAVRVFGNDADEPVTS